MADARAGAAVRDGSAATGVGVQNRSWTDTPSLGPLCDLSGTVVTAVVSVDRLIDMAPRRNHQRWALMRPLLRTLGASPGLLEEIDVVILSLHHEGSGLAVVGDGHGLAWLETWLEPPVHTLSKVSPIAMLGPIVEQRQRDLPYLLVDVDPTGADVSVVLGEHRPAGGEAEASDEPFPTVRCDGWAQRRIETRVSESWDRAARAVASLIDRWVVRHDPVVVLVKGHAPAKRLLREHVGPLTAPRWVDIDDASTTDGSPATTADRVADELVTARQRRTDALVDALDRKLGEGEAAAGPDQVYAALREGRVATLLIGVPNGANLNRSTEIAWTSVAHPTVVGSDKRSVLVPGDPRAVAANAVDVSIRAAIAEGADVWFVPPGQLPSGLCALLREADERG